MITNRTSCQNRKFFIDQMPHDCESSNASRPYSYGDKRVVGFNFGGRMDTGEFILWTQGYEPKKKRTIWAIVAAVVIALAFLSGCDVAWAEGLQASWYSSESLIKEGTRKIGERQVMANGQLFSDTGLTAASCDWRLGQKVKVTRTDTKASVVVLVTDRTAKRFKGKRIDLSKRAFEILSNGKLERGLLPVIVTEV